MKFINVTQREHPSEAIVNVNHIVSIMQVFSSKQERWTRIWTTAIEEGHENHGSVAFTIDTDESISEVMKKIAHTSLNQINQQQSQQKEK